MKDLIERLRAGGVHTLLAQFTDIHGVAKGKLVPLAHLDDLLTDGAGFAGPSIAGTGLPRTGPRAEYFARGNASTTTALPWMPGVARIVCDGFVDGQPFDACPRQVLKRAVARLAERGWHLRTGIEPEFFLLRRDGQRWLPADAQDRLRQAVLRPEARWRASKASCTNCRRRWPAAASTCCRSTMKTPMASTSSTSDSTRRWPAPTT